MTTWLLIGCGLLLVPWVARFALWTEREAKKEWLAMSDAEREQNWFDRQW